MEFSHRHSAGLDVVWKVRRKSNVILEEEAEGYSVHHGIFLRTPKSEAHRALMFTDVKKAQKKIL